MPRYDYRVLDDKGNDTEEVVELVYPMREDKPEIATLDDGRKARYDAALTLQTVNKPGTAGYPHTLWCFSCTPSQVEEYRRMYPDRTYTDSGECITHSLSETNRIAKSEGCVDQSAFAPVRSSSRQTIRSVAHA